MPAEIEATAVICDENPERLAEEIDGMRVLGAYVLDPTIRINIEDVYFDTPDRLLKACAWALRIRRTDEGSFITAKGPVRRSAGGVAVRSELEFPWSREGLLRVWEELPSLGGGDFAEACYVPDPLLTFEKAGLIPIHQRATRRHARAVKDDRSGEPVAELAVDRVTYRFSFGEIVHWEVEIEAKARGGSKAVSDLLRILLNRYGRSLRNWKFGKLATGSAVERLMEKELIGPSIRSDRSLSSEAYDLIEEHFAHRKRPAAG